MYRFEVTRVDSYSADDDPKIEEAKKEAGLWVDRRGTDAPEKIMCYQGPAGTSEWYSNGLNHRVVNSCIERDLEYPAWVVEIDTLEELLALLWKYSASMSVGSRFKGMDGTIELPEKD